MRILKDHLQLRLNHRWRLQWGGGGKAPKPSKQQLRNEELQERLMKAQLASASKPMEFPELAMPQPAAPQAPPPQSTSADVMQAGDDARRQSLKRQSPGRKTILTGESGGYRPSSLGGPKTILG